MRMLLCLLAVAQVQSRPVAECTALSVHGYYPLYTSKSCAETHPESTGSHPVEIPIVEQVYYAPSGVRVWSPQQGHFKIQIRHLKAPFYAATSLVSYAPPETERSSPTPCSPSCVHTSGMTASIAGPRKAPSAAALAPVHSAVQSSPAPSARPYSQIFAQAAPSDPQTVGVGCRDREKLR